MKRPDGMLACVVLWVVATVLSGEPVAVPESPTAVSTAEMSAEEVALTVEEDATLTVDEDQHLYAEEDGLLDRLLHRRVDLLSASYQRLREVPGVTARIAREIILLRSHGRLASYEDLLGIPDMTVERFRRIRRYTRLPGPKRVPPVGVLLRTRVRMSEPDTAFDALPSTSPFKHREYLHQTLRLDSDRLQAGCVFLHRTGEPAITADSAREMFVRKWWALWDERNSGVRVIAGSYRAEYGYGLVFGQGGFAPAQPVKPKSRGLREDTSSMPDVWMHGAAVAYAPGSWECSVFWSDKGCDATLTADGDVNEDLYGIRDNDGAYTAASALRDRDTVRTEMVGGHLSGRAGAARFGCTGYRLHFSRRFNPDKRMIPGYAVDEPDTEYWAAAFRGNALAVGSLHGEWQPGPARVFGEWAVSSGDAGTDVAYTVGVTGSGGPVRPFAVWSGIGDRFHSPYGAPVRACRDALNAQRGGVAGAEVRSRTVTLQAAAGTGALSGGLWTGHALNEMPRYPSAYALWHTEGDWRLGRMSVQFRWREETRDRYLSAERYGFNVPDDRLQVTQRRNRRRVAFEWRPSDAWTLGWSHEHREDTYAHPTERLFRSARTSASARYRSGTLHLGAGADVFSADKDAYAVIPEPRWDGVCLSENETGAAGVRARCWLGWRPGGWWSLWTGYRVRVPGSGDSMVVHSLAVQCDIELGRSDRD